MGKNQIRDPGFTSRIRNTERQNKLDSKKKKNAVKILIFFLEDWRLLLDLGGPS
jgi:hypothetical protein